MWRRRRSAPPEGRRGAGWLGWAALAVVIAGVMGGAVAARDAVVAAWPLAARLYAMAGLVEVAPAQPLTLRNVTQSSSIEGERLVGIFAERDALLKMLWKGDQLDRPVSELMTPDPDTLTPDDTIAFALNRMVQGGYRHVPLVDPAHKPVGVLVMRDVVAYVVSFFAAEVINVPPHSEHDPPDRSVDGG